MRLRVVFILSCMLTVANLLAENTKTISVTFSEFPAGKQYGENEEHNLDKGLIIYTTLCHFTEQLRIYSSATYNGYVISDPLPGPITKMSFRMGYKKDVLNVYGSTDKENWVLVKGIETTSTSYKDYTLDFPVEKGYTCFKLDVKGENQIRIESMSVTYISSDDDNNEGTESGGDDNDGDVSDDDKDEDPEGGSGSDEDPKEEEVIVVSAPIFNPVSTSFSTDFLEVSIEAANGCEIYYTKDGSTPSYTNAEEYVGIKDNVATINASESKVTLQAIAVNPATGKCSNISSATYTYVSIVNDGSKDKPYTVAEVAAMEGYKGGKWVKGTIYGVGLVENETFSKIETSNFTINSNIALGDDSTHIFVQLPGGNIRNKINLKDHPYLKGKEILIKGNLGYYNKVRGVKEPTEFKITYNVPINSYGFATLFLDMSVSVPSTSTAFYCTTNGDQVSLLPVGSVIPDSTGVVIQSTPNTVCTLTYTTTTNPNEDSIRVANQMIGFTKDSVVVMGDYDYYALNAKDNDLGFYIPRDTTVLDNGVITFNTKANKAYLEVPSKYSAAMYLIQRINNETTNELHVPSYHLAEDIIYDLQGRVVSSPAPGVYIRAGKKVVIK